ncbi:hypothetical protein E2C01_083886 [Portunus trituberculatus]|uniref:Uncharacterized protein n=1 Tax=Portunus trituberculatus TaxID=210409 RepID=A0A5B7J2S6_PORTR|nr:hypothetical protein [Portunus trituberculatus]
MRNVRLHARDYHFCYAFSTKKWVCDTETVIVPGKNQHNTSSGSPNWQRQDARGTSIFGDPEEGLEKLDKIQK